MKLGTCPRNKTYNTPSRHACTPSAYNSARITNIYKLPIHLNVYETSAALLLIYVFDTATELGNNLNLTWRSQLTDSRKTIRNARIQNRPGLTLASTPQQNHTRARARKLQWAAAQHRSRQNWLTMIMTFWAALPSDKGERETTFRLVSIFRLPACRFGHFGKLTEVY